MYFCRPLTVCFPESTIEAIVDEMHTLYQLTQESVKKHVKSLLRAACVSTDVDRLANDILDGILDRV